MYPIQFIYVYTYTYTYAVCIIAMLYIIIYDDVNVCTSIENCRFIDQIRHICYSVI